MKKKSSEMVKGLKILLVEDNFMNKLIVKEILEDYGMLVVIASNGQEAFELFSKSNIHEFDAVLMDMVMPVMDGREATRLIRALEREDALTVPIVSMSAETCDADEKLSRESGITAFMTKPITPEIMLKVISDEVKKNKKCIYKNK